MSAFIDEEAAMAPMLHAGVDVPPPPGPWLLPASSIAQPPTPLWTSVRLCIYTLATVGALLVFALGISSTHRWNDAGGWDTGAQPQVGQIVIGAHTVVTRIVEQRVLEREPAPPCNQTTTIVVVAPPPPQPPAEPVAAPVPPAPVAPVLSPHWLPPSNRTHVSVLQLCRAAHSIVLDSWIRPDHNLGSERIHSCSAGSQDGILNPAALEPWRTYAPDRDALCQMNLSWIGIRGTAAPFVTLPLVPVHNLVWKVWEVDVDVDAGEIIVPLLYLQWRQGQTEGNDIAPSYTHNSILPYAFELLASRGMMLCVVEYSDGRSVTVKPSVVATSGDAVRGVLCPFEPLRRVMAVSVRIDVPADAGAVEWRELHPPSFSPFPDGAAPPLRFGADAQSSEFHAAFRLLLCHSFQRRVHVAITSRTLYGSTTPLADVMDFIDAHRRIGVDQFVMWDHDRRLWGEDQDASSAHWGRLKHAIDAGYLEYDVMPQALGSHQLQVILMYVASLRLKRRANWLLAIDIDEFLVLPPPQQLYPRLCSNSLWCPSPIADWIRTAGLAGYGSVMLDTGHVMGRSMPIPPAVLTEMFPPEQQWRVATQADQMLTSLDPRAKQICPYEPETPVLADHLRRWHEERARNSTNHVSACTSLPYAVRYTLGFAPYYQRRLAGTPWNLRKNAGKSMIRLSLLLQPGVHTSSTLRKTRRFDQDRELEAEFWNHAHILHYVDQGGGRTWPIVNDPAKLAEFWSTQPKQYLRHETLTRVQETVPLPPSNNEP